MKVKLDSDSRLIALIGRPVAHSLSPIMHNYISELLKQNLVYLAFEPQIEMLESAFKGLLALNAVGFNVTVPYKEAVLPFIDEVAGNAKVIGAVNTVAIKNGKTYGYNTDISGFQKSLLEAGYLPLGTKVLVLGSGGAAKAVIKGLLDLGVKHIYLSGRNKTKIKELVVIFGAHNYHKLSYIRDDEIIKVSGCIDLLVNTTPVGLKGFLEHDTPIAADLLGKDTWIYDLVYNPIKTVLLRNAQAKGSKVLNGLGMLIHQGIDAYQIWTGLEPPRQVVADFINNYLANVGA